MARPVTSFWRRLARHDASWPPDSLIATASAHGGVLLRRLVFFWQTRRSTLDARRSTLDA
jgi:hypothetical protein